MDPRYSTQNQDWRATYQVWVRSPKKRPRWTSAACAEFDRNRDGDRGGSGCRLGIAETFAGPVICYRWHDQIKIKFQDTYLDGVSTISLCRIWQKPWRWQKRIWLLTLHHRNFCWPCRLRPMIWPSGYCVLWRRLKNYVSSFEYCHQRNGHFVHRQPAQNLTEAVTVTEKDLSRGSQHCFDVARHN